LSGAVGWICGRTFPAGIGRGADDSYIRNIVANLFVQLTRRERHQWELAALGRPELNVAP